MMALEDRYNVSLGENEFRECKTFGEMVDVMEKNYGEETFI
jgi:acyl carrier protein